MWTQQRKTAAAGVAAIASVGLAIGVYLAQQPDAAPAGPSELTLYPERHDEIVALRRAEMLAERLDLTPAQTAEVGRIIQAYRAESIAMQDAPPGDIVSRIQARRDVMLKLGDDIRAVLTPEQQAKFDGVRSEIVGNMDLLRRAFGLPEPPGGIDP